jgi:hypothetical protein
MFSFLFDFLYWILLGAVLVITAVVTLKSFSPGVISKRPGSIALNNLLILAGFGLLVVVFIQYSWLAAILTIIAALIVMGIGGRVVERRMISGPLTTVEPATDYLRENVQRLNVRDEVLAGLVSEYKDLRVVIEPLREKMTKKEISALFAMIASSDELLVDEKAVAHFALDAILDGTFPPANGLVQLEKVFGAEFVKSILEKDAELRSNS